MKQKKRKKIIPKKRKILFPFAEILFPALILVILNIAFIASQNIRFQHFGKYVLYSAKSAIAKEPPVKMNIPYHKQEHSLSCEIASLKMALNYYGVVATESELLNLLPFDTRLPRSKNNVWGDPDLGFVGNIDGKIPNGGYGVYEKPIYDLAYTFGRTAIILSKQPLSAILTEVEAGHPAIVWGTLASGKDISWVTKSGKKIHAIYGEHARVISGFDGTPENPTKIFLLDPIYGEIIMSKEKFLENWGLLNNKAVVVY